jgi:hypothetical protein
MPHISLTQLGAEWQWPGDIDQIFWGKNLPGFGPRVSTKGVKTSIVQYAFANLMESWRNDKRSLVGSTT